MQDVTKEEINLPDSILCKNNEFHIKPKTVQNINDNTEMENDTQSELNDFERFVHNSGDGIVAQNNEELDSKESIEPLQGQDDDNMEKEQLEVKCQIRTGETPPKKKLHRCQYCQKIFGTDGYLTAHLKVHTGEKRQVIIKNEINLPDLILCEHGEFQIKVEQVEHTEDNLEKENDAKWKVKNLERICRPCFVDLSNDRIVAQNDDREEHEELIQGQDDENIEEEQLELKCQIPTGETPTPNQTSPRRKLRRCQYCRKIFKTDRYLMAHLKVHTGEKQWECEIENCGKKYSCKDSLVRHKKTCSNDIKKLKCNKCGEKFRKKVYYTTHICGEKSYKCPVCNIIFTDKYRRTRHMAIHTGEKRYECEVCKVKFRDSHGLSLHMQTHFKTEVFECDICHKTFSRKKSIQHHLLQKHLGMNHKCDKCRRKFTSESGLINHLRIHEGEKPYKCVDCGKVFKIESDCIKHRRRIHFGEKPYECKDCRKRFFEKAALNSHTLFHHSGKNPHKCGECLKTFSDKKVLKSHLLTHKERERQHKCDLCALKFFDKVTLTNHRNRIHTGKKPHKCSSCEKSYLTERELTEHMRAHTNEKPFPCEACGKAFPRKNCLASHRKSMAHLKKVGMLDEMTTFKCNHCLKTFYKQHLLDLHLKKHDVNRKYYECDKCQKKLFRRSNLIGHVLSHFGEKPHQCEVCHRRFSNKQSFCNHRRMHTLGKNIKCKLCEKSFNFETQLKIHLRYHTGERPYKCANCQKAFLKKYSLTSHMMRIHFREKPKFECNECKKRLRTKTSLIYHLRIHSGEKPFKCKECGSKFRNKFCLTEHTRIHTGEVPYKCNECGKGFAHKKTMINHFKNRSNCKGNIT